MINYDDDADDVDDGADSVPMTSRLTQRRSLNASRGRTEHVTSSTL